MNNHQPADLINIYLSLTHKMIDIQRNRAQTIEKIAISWEAQFGPLSTDLKRILGYIIPELFDNIQQHSQATAVEIFHKKDDKYLAFLVVDNGVTIPKSLKAGISEAIKGKSSKKDQGRGFGLPSILSLTSNLDGQLIIISGNDIFTYNENKDCLDHDNFQGTIVGVNFPLTLKCDSKLFYKLIG